MLWLITDLLSSYSGPGICFYLYIFCATLANVLITLLLPVRHPTSPALLDISDHATRLD